MEPAVCWHCWSRLVQNPLAHRPISQSLPLVKILSTGHSSVTPSHTSSKSHELRFGRQTVPADLTLQSLQHKLLPSLKWS
jgi:hypothetical protein